MGVINNSIIRCTYGEYTLEPRNDEYGNTFFDVYDADDGTFKGELWGYSDCDTELSEDCDRLAEGLDKAFDEGELMN